VALSDADIGRARYHLGYMDVVIASSFAFAIPAATQVQFMFESAIRRVQQGAEPRVRQLLDMLDQIECTLFQASKELFAKRVDALEPNLEQPTDVEREYVRWACRLSDILGITPYPFSERFRVLAQGGLSGARAGIISVRR
jgi:hypothetical protein